MGTVTVALLIVGLGWSPLAVLWVMFHRRGPGWANRGGRQLVHLLHPTPVQPANRPIEEIAVNVRRLGLRYHNLHPHAAYAKVAAVRAAYDGALGECCEALGVPHLLGVLPPGPDLDVERHRVEIRLADSGFVFPDAA